MDGFHNIQSTNRFSIRNIQGSDLILTHSPKPWYREKAEKVTKKDIKKAVEDTLRHKRIPKDEYTVGSVSHTTNILYILCLLLIIIYIFYSV